ncbi:MAG: sensor histidine kinase [Lepagella sp.]
MKHISLYIDLAFCLLILPLMIFAFPVERWWATAPIYFSLFIVWLYANYFLYTKVIVPHLFRDRRHRWIAAALIVASLAITAGFSAVKITSPYYHLRQEHVKSEAAKILQWGVRPNRQAVWLHYIIVVSFCFAVGMTGEVYSQRLERETIESARRQAELALYKAQVNPHFLFNTLNSIYGLMITNSELTLPMLEKFISLTKYMYHNAHRDFISLREEKDYIEQFIDLQSLRVGDNARVEFSHHIEDGAQDIPPMLLINFVENAFKYGISSSDPCFVKIALNQRNGIISFSVRNSIVSNKLCESAGIGIENSRKRLELLCQGCYALTYGKVSDDVYGVSLTICRCES